MITIAGTQTTGDLILHILKDAQLHSWRRMQVSGTSSGLYYFFLILLKGKAPSFAKVGNWVSDITFLHALPLWPLEPERPGDKNQHRMRKDILK